MIPITQSLFQAECWLLLFAGIWLLVKNPAFGAEDSSDKNRYQPGVSCQQPLLSGLPLLFPPSIPNAQMELSSLNRIMFFHSTSKIIESMIIGGIMPANTKIGVNLYGRNWP